MMTNLPKEHIMTTKEPTDQDIKKLMQKDPRHSYYSAREYLRKKAYGGNPPNGYIDWGTYWKTY
jgi:hypothetical protein